MAETLLDRMADKVLIGDGCWEWTGGKCQGHGVIRDGSTVRRVHRVLYEMLVGPIPKGLDLDHVCHNADESCAGGVTCAHRRCVRPDHLEPVTRAVNASRGRSGENNRSKTHCPQGHPYDEANTYVRRDRANRRECRACRSESRRRLLG